MKKIFVVFLALLLVLPLALNACTDKGGSPAETKSGASGTEATAATETEAETIYKPDNLPADLKFDGATVTTFGWAGMSGKEEFTVESPNGEVVNDAIWQRNSDTEERLNVKLAFYLPAGDYNNRNAWINELSTAVLAGDDQYDIAAGYSMCMATLAYKRLVQDMNKLPYLDFSQPWWPDSIMNEATVNGRLYFASGDISTYLTYYMLSIFFNLELLDDFKLEDPRELVLSGKWTFDKLAEMAAKCYKDVNGDGAVDLGDSFGFVSAPTYIDAFYFSAGLHIIEKDNSGKTVISPDFGSEKTHEVLNKYINTIEGNNGILINNTGVSGMTGLATNRAIFGEGRTPFILVETHNAAVNFREYTFDYSVVPVPKYSEDQKNYVTTMSNPVSLYGIPVSAKAPATSAAVLECLGSEGYRTISPALFEVGLKMKYSPDDLTAQMYDIQRASVSFDLGRPFNDSLDNVQMWFRSSLTNGDGDWISFYKSKESLLNEKFEDIVKALTED